MKSLKQIRQARFDRVRVITDICPKRCVENGPPGLWCGACDTARTQEMLLAWVSDEESVFKSAISATLAEMKKLRGTT